MDDEPAGDGDAGIVDILFGFFHGDAGLIITDGGVGRNLDGEFLKTGFLSLKCYLGVFEFDPVGGATAHFGAGFVGNGSFVGSGGVGCV